MFLRAVAGSCETCDTSTDLAGPRHKALDRFRFGVMAFLVSLSLLPWMTAAFTQTEQEEENWLILVIAPICFSSVVNNFESAAENRPVNQCPIQILNLPVTQAAQQTATHRRRHLRKVSFGFVTKCKYFNSCHDYLAGNKGCGLDLKMRCDYEWSLRCIQALLYFPTWIWSSNIFISEGELCHRSWESDINLGNCSLDSKSNCLLSWR